jgi:deoxyribodipyrimidine photo-lyase
MSQTTALWWIRRDLRLTDNQALAAAQAEADQVVPVFVFDPKLLGSSYVGEKRVAFLLAALRRLEEDLRQLKSQLVIRHGDPTEALTSLVRDVGATKIFAEADYSPFARQRDTKIAEKLPLELHGGLTVFPPNVVLKDDGSPYTVFTPYSRAWKEIPRPQEIIPKPERISTPTSIPSDKIPETPVFSTAIPFPAGEAEAQRRLEAFVNGSGVFKYGELRNRMDLDGTSRLSPYLRFGMLSARQAVLASQSALEAATSQQARQGAVTWLNELIWREFYVSVLFHFPWARTSNFRQKYDDFPWDNNQANFNAWSAGKTGYPIVDAAMRQLVQSGWMHNRARMIVASFLVKHLLIDWRWGERFFMQHLIDGDPAANNGGWQWTAGSGTDAAPYFRIFNPMLQSQKFDPNGAYIRRWVPELGKVPEKFIHSPWTMPLAEQRRVGCLIGKDYPAPIVDHKEARARALDAFNRLKDGGTDRASK